MESLLRDIRFGLKLLLRERAFTVTVMATLALCIGANVAIFSVVRAVVLEPLPYDEPDELLTIYNSYPGAGVERASNAAVDYFKRRERVDALQEVAAYQGSGHTIGQPGSTVRVETMRVTPSFFPLLGVEPILGRTFTEEEMDPGLSHKAVLTYGIWQERFGGARDIIGSDLRVNGMPYSIVGVLPESFRFVGSPEARFFVPLPFTAEARTLESWHNNSYGMMARLAPGATFERVRAQIEALNAALTEQCPIPQCARLVEDTGYHTEVVDTRRDLLRDVRPTLFMLWAGVAFVLLIGCVNIANLMLARSHVRARELATRLALGAQRMRLARQVLTEAVLIGVLGAVLGTGMGAAGLRLLSGSALEDLPRGATVGIDGAVLLFTLALGVGAAVAFGLIPAIHVFRGNLNAVFREEGRGNTVSRRSALLRNGLVAGQVAVAFLLLMGAGLMFRSYRAATAVDPGFEPENVLTAYVSLPDSRYDGNDSERQFVDRLLARVRALPGVRAAGITSSIPFSGNRSSSVILPEGYELKPGESLLAPIRTYAGPGYFDAMGMMLREGRDFRESDTEGQPNVIIIDEWLANRYWPDSSPIGQRMIWGAVPGEDVEEEDLYTIIGVVGTIKHGDLTATAADHVGAYYFSYRQIPFDFPRLVIRTEVEPTSITASVRRVLADLDPDLPLYGVRTMEQRIAESLASRRTTMMLLLVFAGVALFLAVVGIYGMLAYSVTQRTRELGIRMALGGAPDSIFRLVLSRGLRVTGLGLALGAVATIGMVRLIRSLLFGVEPADPGVLLTVALLLMASAAAACVVPALHATRVDPVSALGRG